MAKKEENKPDTSKAGKSKEDQELADRLKNLDGIEAARTARLWISWDNRRDGT